MRTCVGCRKRELAVVLLRVVAASNRIGTGTLGSDTDVPAVMVDTAGNLPGRGAWMHPDPQCVHAAIRRRAFARALRIAGLPDTSAVIEYVSALPGAEVLDELRQQRTGSEEHEHTVKSR